MYKNVPDTRLSEAPTKKFRRDLSSISVGDEIEGVLGPENREDQYTAVPKATAGELQKLLNPGKNEGVQEMYMNPLKRAADRFNSLMENSPLEAPVSGFNRYVRDMSPTTRDLVLKSRMPEIMAFSEDRKLDPGIVAGVAEASIRLGRIPDLGMYGLGGDEALAVKDFVRDAILNLAEQIAHNERTISEESDSPKAKHLKLASDYKKLADFHKRRAKEESDKARSAKEDGRTHSSIRANAASEEHKALATHCSGLADYHQLKANEYPADSNKPDEKDSDKASAEPPQSKDKEKAPPTKDPSTKTEAKDSDDAAAGAASGEMAGGVVGSLLAGPSGAGVGRKFGRAFGSVVGGERMDKLRNKGMSNFLASKTFGEQTTSQSVPNPVKPVGKKFPMSLDTKAFPKRTGILPILSREPAKAPYFNSRKCDSEMNRTGGHLEMLDGKRMSGQEYPTTGKSDMAEQPKDRREPAEESVKGRFRDGMMLEDILLEAKKAKKVKAAKAKAKSVKKVSANAKIAPMFRELGHKMDHACAKVHQKKFMSKWSKDLQQKCLKDGGSEAADMVIRHSLQNPWVRDMGFTDEASNLRKHWETAMSDDAQSLAAQSPMAPEPVVFAINKIIKMSSK